jgi:transposase
VQCGQITATEAANQLGVSRKTYYEWEKKALKALVASQQERPGGRPSMPHDAEQERLRQQAQELPEQARVLEQTLAIREQMAELNRTKKTPEAVTTIVNQLQTLHEQVAEPYRPLCQASAVPYSTFMRWHGRVARGEPVVLPPGPKPVGELDLAALQAQLRALEHGPQRSAGTTALYLKHRPQISRRGFHDLLEETRREVLRERQADLRRIEWLMPGAVWSTDPTELVLVREGVRQKLPVLPAQDLASRYKLSPLVGERLWGATVAAQLDKLFHRHGPPLVMKIDNASNLNSEEMDEVLRRWWVIRLNSPPYYPPYNGGIERAQRELKSALRPYLMARATGITPTLVALIVHDLNDRPRRCLRGQTACERLAGAKQNMRGYTRRRRKELVEQIHELAMKIMVEQPVRTQGHADVAWRLAVESLLQQEGIISILEPKSVTQLP